MRLTNARLDRLERSLELALAHEWPKLNATAVQLAPLTPSIILPSLATNPRRAIATVATDGGENRLSLEPMELQIVRVADSLGEIYFEEFIARSLPPEEILHIFFESEPRLSKFISYLGLSLQDLLPQSELQSSQLLSMIRELMEWAALVKLASAKDPSLLIRDGLLRSILLSAKVFDRLRETFSRLTAKNGHLLVGVAKRSRVLSYLSVALELSESFKAGSPAYLVIPPQLERQAAPAQYRWIGDRAMGRLCIARLDHGENIPLLPVDVADWQSTQIDEAMSLLHESACASFPLRGYPQALVDAHEYARLGGLEIEILESLLLRKVHETNPAAAQIARELRLLGKKLTEDSPSLELNESA